MATSFGQHVSDFGKKGCPNPECQKEKKALEARIAAARGKQDTLIHQLAHTTAPSEKEKIQRQIDTVDILLADSEAEYSNLPCLISGMLLLSDY